MNSGYVIIFTHDNGAHWQATGMPYPESEAALHTMRASMKVNPDLRFEMHPIHPNLYAALTVEKPVVESFF